MDEMKLTENSSMVEHLQALAESEPEKFRVAGHVTILTMNKWIDLNNPVSQDDWDSILKEIGWEYQVDKAVDTKLGLSTANFWQPIIWRKDWFRTDMEGNRPRCVDVHFNEKNLAASAAGCAAIRGHLREKK